MSGETGREVSGWTIDSLKEMYDKRLIEMDLRYQQRFDAQTKALDAALQAQEKAVSKAEIAAEKRFDGVNEFRKTLSDQTATFMPRIEVEARFSSLSEKVDLVSTAQTTTTARSSGIGDAWGYLLGVVGLVATIATIIATR